MFSREYKVMLKAKPFSNGGLPDVVGEFGREFQTMVLQGLHLKSAGALKPKKAIRTVRFYDTGDDLLRSNHYVFRERARGKGKREVTLKFRHPDRYVTGGRNMEPGDLKFEQDVKTPFRSLYSFSSKQRVPASKVLNTLKDPGELFPDLARQLPRYDESEPIRVVNGFAARETIFKGMKFELERSPRTLAECAVILWHGDGGNHEPPLVAEFSFRYDAPKGGYTRKSAENAYNVFMAIQEELTGWIDTHSPTKTAYVYGIRQTADNCDF